jgi:hypothetical protein
MDGLENIPPAPAPAPAPPPPPPAPVPEPPPPVNPQFDQGGNINQQSWLKSIDWLQAGLIFLSALGIMSVIQYHRLKIKNLKTEIPAAKKRMDEMEMQISELSEKKVDKKQPGQKPNIGI